MKKILLLLALVTFSNGFSQNPELFQTWYLTSYSYDMGNTFYVENINPKIAPLLTIGETLAYTGEGACNDYSGQFDYDSNTDELILTNFGATLNDCDFQSHIDFETDYFGYFIQSLKYSYSINSGSGTEKFLTLSFAPGFDLVYQNFQLAISENNISTVKIYPNPVSEKLFIASEVGLINKLSVYSITGQKVFETTNFDNYIPVSQLSKGMYFLEIVSEENRSVMKFIKN